ncbi:MAG: ADP-ribosylglycohydrolase family protein [Firmicutes bacterium]|nr:ADP-ribosylglycohydrolase family protein [Bacillota bacterium]
MLGAIIGDIVGSVYEWNNIKSTDFPLFVNSSSFTDDTVMTIAVGDALLSISGKDLDDDVVVRHSIQKSLILYGKSYPNVGYGSRFRNWIFSENHIPYNSYGNGSAMRVSSVAYFALDLEDALRLARLSAEVTHNHLEGIRGAEAIAGCIYLAKSGEGKDVIRDFVQKEFYSLDFTLNEIRDDYQFDVTCQGSVPQAICAFLEGKSFEDVIRLAVSIGGDSDTIAAIAGSIGEAFYGVPDDLKIEVKSRLDPWLNGVVGKFYKRININ